MPPIAVRPSAQLAMARRARAPIRSHQRNNVSCVSRGMAGALPVPGRGFAAGVKGCGFAADGLFSSIGHASPQLHEATDRGVENVLEGLGLVGAVHGIDSPFFTQNGHP